MTLTHTLRSLLLASGLVFAGDIALAQQPAGQPAAKGSGPGMMMGSGGYRGMGPGMMMGPGMYGGMGPGMMMGPGMHGGMGPGMMMGPGMHGGMGPGMMMGPGMYGGMGPGMMYGMMDHGPLLESRLAYIKAVLGITSDQTAAWDAYAKAQRARYDAMNTMHTSMYEAMRTGTPVSRIAAHIKGMEAMLASLKEVQPALDGLYKALSDDQKKRADYLLGMG